MVTLRVGRFALAFPRPRLSPGAVLATVLAILPALAIVATVLALRIAL